MNPAGLPGLQWGSTESNFMKIRFRYIIFVVACLIPLLACNLPRFARPAAALPSGDLRKTLAALPVTSGVPTPFPPGSVVSVTPAPATPAPTAFPPTPVEGLGNTYSYVTRPGDTLPGLAGRFGVHPEEITSPVELDPRDSFQQGLRSASPLKKKSIPLEACSCPIARSFIRRARLISV